MPLSYVESIGDGIHVIDTGFHRPRFDASYLIVEGGRAAFVDTGTNFAVPRLLQTLADLGLGPDAVDFVIPTHVHLDHAGGVGLLMQSLPKANVLVHPRGVRHMVDPSALYQGALAVYGAEEMARSYGTLLPIDADRVQGTYDGLVVELGGRALRFADTPGHARHHHCLWDPRTRGWFTGDTFGLSYREFDTPAGPWILPTSTPVQFEPDVLRGSIQRLLAEQPACMYLTHYGRVDRVPALADMLLEQLDALVALARDHAQAPQRHQALVQAQRQLFAERLKRHGIDDPERGLELLALDVELNAQGLAVWLDRESH